MPLRQNEHRKLIFDKYNDALRKTEQICLPVPVFCRNTLITKKITKRHLYNALCADL